MIKDYIKIVSNNTSLSVPANGNNQYTITLNVPTGYNYGIHMIRNGNSNMVWAMNESLIIESSTITLKGSVQSRYTSNLTVSIYIRAIFFRNL